MDRYTKITKEALQYLAFIIASCTPLCRSKQEKNEEYVLSLATRGKDISFSKFLQDLPQKSDLYTQLYEFKKEQEEIDINVKTLCRFFGGRRHIEKAVSDIAKMECDLSLSGWSEEKKKGLRMFFTFIHILVPLRIEKFDGQKRCSGVYENYLGEKHVKFNVENLMTFRKIRHQIQTGRIAYSHYASIICVPSGKFSAAVTNEILREQAKSPDFMRAAEYFSKTGINFDKAAFLREAAEKVAEKYNL